MIVEIKPNQRWINNTTGQTVRVMGVVENYVVCRHKGAMPFLRLKRDFYLNYEITGSMRK